MRSLLDNLPGQFGRVPAILGPEDIMQQSRLDQQLANASPFAAGPGRGGPGIDDRDDPRRINTLD